MKRSTAVVTLALVAAMTGVAGAQNPTAPPKPAQASTAPKPAMHKVKEAQPGLLKQAKIKADAAEQTAIAGMTGAKVTSREIERQKGVLVYAFHVKTEGQEGYQAVTVDANTGSIVSNTHVTAPKVVAHTPKKKPPQE